MFVKLILKCVFSGICGDVNEVCDLLGSYATWNVVSIRKVRGNIRLQYSRINQSKQPRLDCLSGTHVFSETSVWKYHSTLRKIPEECQSNTAIPHASQKISKVPNFEKFYYFNLIFYIYFKFRRKFNF